MNLKKLKKGCAIGLTAIMISSIAVPINAEAATWKKNKVGWWWQEDDGSWPESTWKTVNGKRYCFNQQGYMRYGWFLEGSTWYYLGGANDGAMKTGWQKVKGTWYYLNPDGTMATGWTTVKGKKYYLENSGAMAYGWKHLNGNWYYFGSANDGSMKTGWQLVNGKWYYMYDDGKMAANTWIGQWYVNGSGAWTKTKEPAKWIKSGARWWYRHEDGGYTTNGFETINGKKYYFDAAGWMVTGWKKINNQWYYFDASGAMATNQWIGNYYVGSNGVMATNTWIGKYYVDASGKWDSTKQPEKEPEEKPVEKPDDKQEEDTSNESEEIKLTTLGLGTLNSWLMVGDETDMEIYYYPYGVSVDKLEAPTWSSSDTNVLTVDEHGHVKAVGAGIATIYIQIGDVIGQSAEIFVQETIPMERFYYDWGDNYTLKAGESLDLKETMHIVPDNANVFEDWIFSSSDINVAIAMNGGLVAYAPGTTTITVGVNGQKTSFTLTVTE